MIGHHCQYTSLCLTFQLGCRPCDSVWLIKYSETLQKHQVALLTLKKKEGWVELGQEVHDIKH